MVAVDVGYGQLVWRLRSDDRVRVHDRTNVRTLKRRRHRRSRRPHRRGPVVHLPAHRAARARRLHPAGGRAAADGQAAVRGRTRAARFRRGRARPGAAPHRPGRGRHRRAGAGVAYCATRSPAHCRARRATSSSSCGSSATSSGRTWVTTCWTEPSPRAPDDGNCDDGGGAMTREVLVVLHAGRPTNRYTAAEVARRLAADGVRLRMIDDEWNEVAPLVGDLPAEMAPRMVDARPGCADGAEVALVLGGDGTLLRAAETARPIGVPLLGRQPGPRRVPRRGRAGVPQRGLARDHRRGLRRRGADDGRRRGVGRRRRDRP